MGNTNEYVENTTFDSVIESFESSYVDKEVIPTELENIWLMKAIGRYSIKLEELEYDEDSREFNSCLDRAIIDTLAQFMYQYYQERQVSKVNKRVSIVGKDLSIDGSNGTKTSEKALLDYLSVKSKEMIQDATTPAYN